MNWLLIVILAILALCTIRGWNRGFLRILYSLVSIVLLIGIVAYATPHISGFMKEHTGVYEAIQERCTEGIQKNIETQIENEMEGDKISDQSLPKQIVTYIIGNGENALVQAGAYEKMGAKAADFLLAGISFFITLILALILVNAIGRMLDIVNKIPVIKGINRTIGIFAGLFQGLIIVWLILLFVMLISGTEGGKICLGYINENFFLRFLYYNNGLLKIFSMFFKI